jgi:hypothetical protein
LKFGISVITYNTGGTLEALAEAIKEVLNIGKSFYTKA